jgi:hypothetical protein
MTNSTITTMHKSTQGFRVESKSSDAAPMVITACPVD